MKRICYFGSFLDNYPRNKILIKGLKENGCEVVFCQDFSSGIFHYLFLIIKFFKLHKNCDAIIVGVFGLYDVWIASILGKLFNKKIFYDAFISLYDTYVFDRKIFKKHSFGAFKIYLWEYLACQMADIIYLDTLKHTEYFRKTFNIKRNKIKYIFVGADSEYFKLSLQKKANKKMIINFYGSYQPLQGVDFIVKAAAKFNGRDDILFQIIGEGQTKKEVVSLARKLRVNNIEFVGWKKIEELAKIVRKADICLGIFGKSNKAYRVIPNKAYEALAMGKPLITMKSDAIEELLTDKENVMLVNNNNPNELYDAINLLITNPQLRERIGLAGYKLYQKKLDSRVLGKKLLDLINQA